MKLLIIGALIQTCWAVISIENNKYKGIVVAIHNSVEENATLVNNLKELFTSASEVLYKVSRNRSYFDDIAIIVPANWTYKPEFVKTIGGNRFSVADFRIDQPNEMYGNVPYTLQADSCGKSGQYVHITPEFINELQGKTTDTFGDPGKTLVHEWAHYRYGVFDEYADSFDERTSRFYYDADNNIRVTGCMENIPGWLADDGGQCRLGPDGLPNDNCEFFPDFNAEGARSSLMYMHYLPIVEGFCDDTEELKHNTAAPNQQNVMCGGKSTWEVVSHHPDFLNDNNPPRPDLNPKPKFRILQPMKEDGGYFVLLLDVSGSMSGRRIAMLHRSAIRFIQTQVPDKSQLAIVTFSSEPKLLARLTLVTPKSRQQLADRVPNNDDEGNTAIGQGLKVAVQVLDEKGATDGGVIILISDGEENVDPNITTVLPEILRSRVKINTIAFGNKASLQLEKLIRLTGGQGFFFSDEDIIQNKVATLQAAFFAAISTQADVELQPVELNNKVFDMPPGSEKRGKIVIDEAIGKNTQFVFTSVEPSELELALKSPKKRIHNNRTKSFIPDNGTGAATFIVPMAEPGKWEYRIKNNFHVNQVVGVSVISEPKDIRKQPIRIKAWISDVQFNYTNKNNEAKIFAEVKKKYTPVLGATVVATVERPFGDTIEVELYDTGAGADLNKNDGIYSAYFTQFWGSGRYSVSARVINDGNARLRVKKMRKMKNGALVVTKGNPKMESTPSRDKFDPEEFDDEPELLNDNYIDTIVSDFQRSLLVGAFLLNGWTEKDIIPPNKVIDLQAVTLIEQCVNLSWTAAGDDLDSGTANRTEIRFHNQSSEIYRNFQGGYLVTESDIKNGTLTPTHGGRLHSVVICSDQISIHNLNTIYFALRNYDDENNVGSISNIARAHFYEPEIKKQKLPKSQLALFIVGALVGAVILLVIGLVILRGIKKNLLYEKEFK